MQSTLLYVALLCLFTSSGVAQITVDTVSSSCDAVTLNFRSDSDITSVFTQGTAVDIAVIDTLPNRSITVTAALLPNQLVGEAVVRIVTDGISGEFVHIQELDARLLPPPSITPGTNQVCEGQRTTLQVGGSFTSYEWSTGSTSASILVGGGNYTVRVRTAEGCVASTSISISELPAPATPFIQNVVGRTVLCEGETTELSTFSSSFERIVWSTGETTAAITVSSSGNYTVTGYNALGCHSTSETMRIQVLPAPLQIVEATSGVYSVYGGHATKPVTAFFSVRNRSSETTTLRLHDVQFAANSEFSVKPSQFPLEIASQQVVNIEYTFWPNGNDETSDILTIRNGCRNILYTFAGFPERNTLRSTGRCSIPLYGDIVDRRIHISHLFPSSVQALVFVETENSNPKSDIEYSITRLVSGEVVATGLLTVPQGWKRHQISVESLPSGVYMVLFVGKGSVHQPFVKY